MIIYDLYKENIDIALLGGGLMWNSDCQGIEIIQNYIKLKHIVLMHIHHNDNKKFIGVASELENELSGVMVFQNRMDTKSYILE